MLKAFKKLITASRELNNVQQNVADFTNQLTRLSILDGSLIEGVTLAAGANQINHNLGREYRGWILTGTSADSTLWADPTLQVLKSSELVISASAPTTISIYIF